MPDEPVISLRDVSFSFDGTAVLSNVELEIQPKDFTLIVGPNGGGKTTLVKIVLGLLEPRKGTVKVFGTDPKDARRRIGYMPQHVQFDPHFPVTVGEIVSMGRLGHGSDIGPLRRGDRQAVDRVLEITGCAPLKNRPFASLSGGQRQLCLIARALACGPDMLILDEPTANLDPMVQDTFNNLLHHLNQELTVILVSHDIGFVTSHSNKVVCVNRRVQLHPTSKIQGDLVSMIYGDMGVRLIHHD